MTHFRKGTIKKHKALKKHLEALPVFLYLISHNKTGAKMLTFVFFIGMIQLIQAYKSMLLETKMPYDVSDMTATLFDGINYNGNDDDDDSLKDDARIYIVGGCISNQTYDASLDMYICTQVSNKVSYYKPSRDVWKKDLAPAPTARFRHVAARLGAKLYIAGGRDVSDSIVSTIDVYDTILDTWSTISAPWADATSDGGAFTYDSQIYLIGGYDAYYNLTSTLYAFNPSASTFTTKVSMTYPRGDIAVATKSNYAYVFGGWNASDNFCTALNYAERYDMISNSWETMANMLYKRGDLATGVIGNYIFSIAGETKNSDCTLSVPVNTVGRYDTEKNTWSVEEELSLNLFRFVGVSYNSTELDVNVIYLFGGQGIYDSNNDYYPVKSTSIKYTPYSTISADNSLSPVSIFGIVIGVLAFVTGVTCLALSYLAYARRGYYTKKDVSLSSAANASFVNDDGDEEIDIDLKAANNHNSPTNISIFKSSPYNNEL